MSSFTRFSSGPIPVANAIDSATHAVTPFATSVTTHSYGSESHQSFNVHSPTDTFGAVVLRPTVLCFHGGGYAGGDHNDPTMTTIATGLAERGFTAITATYRSTIGDPNPPAPDPILAQFATLPSRLTWDTSPLLPQHSAEYVAAGIIALEDALAVLDHIQANYHAYNVDPERFGVVGGSAGGWVTNHITYCHESGYFAPREIHACVSLVSNFQLADPAHCIVPGDTPPIYMVNGALDSLIKIQHVNELTAAITAAGSPFVDDSYVEVNPNAGHFTPGLFDIAHMSDWLLTTLG